MEASDDTVQKTAYAALLIQEQDPYKAAFALFPGNTNRSIRVAAEWPSDPIVINEKARLVKEARENLDSLPTKHDLARAVWDRMKGADDDEAFVKLAKVYGEINGFIEKPQTQTNVNIQQNRVMTLRDMGSDSDWESAVLDQQRRLASGKY